MGRHDAVDTPTLMPATPRGPLKLSKSRVQSGRQCAKRLWLEIHDRDTMQWSDAAQVRLQEGTRFGELARDLLGGGLLIDADHRHPEDALHQTSAALAKPRHEAPRLFEAAFEHRDVRVRVDAFERGARGDTLIEVKSTTQVKDEYLWDCAIQTWVARGAGRNVRKVLLALVDRDFVYRRDGNFDGILKLEDITSEVEERLPRIPEIVRRLAEMARGPSPGITTGPQCRAPYECPFIAHCRSGEPEPPKYPIDLLPYGRKAVEKLQALDYTDLRKVPDHLLDSDLHKRIGAATRRAKPFVADELGKILDQIPFPRFHLDIETVSFVVPRWKGSRPFEPLPFQFSCHEEREPGDLRHASFLDVSGSSPLAAFAERLVEVLGTSGPVLVWNMAFEKSRILALAQRFPKQRRALSAIARRLVDLLPIYREHYYHRDMLGSWSIKAVLPTIAPDLRHDRLDIADGQAAQAAWHEASHPDTTPRRRDELRGQMLDYCERDTLALVRLANWRPASPKPGKPGT
ncbi:DUF2779 domain-containing protein [Dokdonella sp. MW10]|uniref:DUF2779 domain-containing protein n=1 Tax=Dokdonella sp. MW10 TaxID=2992926 RepID=UPI003F80BDD3